jgi:hypothetical protein
MVAAVSFVHPASIDDMKRDLHPALDALHRELAGAHADTTSPRAREIAALVDAWNAWLARPCDWLTAPDVLQMGCHIEARIATLQGPPADGRPHTTGPDRPQRAGQSGGIVTPGDVLAYRKTWDDYVMGTARAAAACAVAWQALADGTTPSTPPNVSQFAIPPDQKTMSLWAQTQQQHSDGITESWNMHADKPDWQVVVQAGDILQDFQRTVQRVGSFYQPQIAKDCPAIELPKPPSFDLQSQVIGRIEGLGILAHGVLQLLGIGVGGALQTYGAIAQQAGEIGKKVGEAAERALDVAPIVIVGGVLFLGLVMAVRR